jgi:alpha-beta hydrolase superfamily lysophospholipase
MAIVKAYEKDVYVHDKISARLAADLLESGQIALKKAPQWELPLLLMHGTADRITSRASTEAFADRVEAPLKLVLWDGFFHELHHDLGSENVIQTVIEWLDHNTP